MALLVELYLEILRHMARCRARVSEDLSKINFSTSRHLRSATPLVHTALCELLVSGESRIRQS